MVPTKKPASPARAVVEALVAGGLIPQERVEDAVRIAEAKLPRQSAPQSFTADTEFLHASLGHHVTSYFKQVMAPLARTHHAKDRTGRLLKDAEVEEAAVTIASLVVGELGESYLEHLFRYFGDGEGLAAYVFTRVRDRLLDEATKHNEEYLNSIARNTGFRKIAEA
jgi:hypothetical protein